MVGERHLERLRQLYHRQTTHRYMRRDDRRANRQADLSRPGLYVVSEAGVPHAYDYFIAWLEEHDPELRSRLWLEHMPGQLPTHAKAMHAWMQDPVRERDAALFRAATALEDEVLARGGTVLQPVRVLSNSTRTELEQRLSAVGLRTPRTVIVSPHSAEPFAGLQPPFVVRKEWGHLVPMHRCQTFADAEPLLQQARASGERLVASEYIETVSPDGLYRKYRYLMAGPRGMARHMIASPNWEVRPKDRVVNADVRDEELAFVNAPFTMHDVFDAARRQLEFDIAAFDYSFDASGNPVVWEVNPFPDLSMPSAERAPHLKETGIETFRLLANYYRDALAE
jgi:hypothetical protein